MAEAKDVHKCNKKLVDEGNEEEEQESFWKEKDQRIFQLPEWNVWWIEEQWDKAKVEGVTSNPTGF